MAMKTKSEKVIIWLIFSVVLSLLPVAINFINGRFMHPHPPLTELILGGELFLISAAIAADAVGRAFLGGTKYRKFRILCGAGCLFTLVATSLYAFRIAEEQWRTRVDLQDAIRNQDWEAAAAVSAAQQGDEDIASDSVLLFGLTVLTAFGAILVEED